MPKLHVIVASTRRDRKGPLVAAWFLDRARARASFDLELVDLAELDLPLLDEPRHPRFAQYEHEHTRRWSAIVDRADAFVVVTPEYDHGAPASLVNALQYLVREWAYKPMGFVSYGGVSGGTRGVQMTKQIVTALKIVPLVEAVAIPFFAQHVSQETGAFDPGEVQAKAAEVMLDELLRWSAALAPLRAG
ncbi:MAG TPA: NAD(P)H-dependent oxidoreductase [Gemmatimonadaceae bacterium]|nr:NAD(P)H-dependent oxidoreductase [Gemmatimonadaceae bacterium]